MVHEPHSAVEAVEAIEDIARTQPCVSFGNVLDEFGRRSFGPFLLIPPFVEFSPLGGIPGVPTLLALFLANVAVQLLIGRDHVWLPHFLEKRAVRSEQLLGAGRRLEAIAAWLDARVRGRLRTFSGHAMQRVAASFIILLCCTVPPLELLPFASSIPMVAIAAFGLAILVRDGLLMLVASALSVAALVVGAWLVSTSQIGEVLGLLPA